MSKKFKHLEVPDHWRQYWSKYPQGYTILEALINWVSQVDDMTDNVNDWNEYLVDFVETFDEKLQPTVSAVLREMVDDGTFERLINETVFEGLNDKIDDVERDLLVSINDRYVTERVELLVPSQFPSILSAITYATTRHNTANVVSEVILESGFVITSPTYLSNGDYAHITLSSQDDVVYITGAFNSNSDALTFSNCNAPTINTLIDAQGNCNVGINVLNGSRIRVNPDCGIINSGKDNIYVRYSSSATIRGGIFNGAGQNNQDSAGITAWDSSIVSATSAQTNGCLGYGVRSAHGSSIAFDYGSADNAGYHGIRATKGANLTCGHASAKNAGSAGIYALDGSTINARVCDVSGAGSTGFSASNTSRIDANQGVADNCATGVTARYGSIINFNHGQAHNCSEIGVRVTNSSVVEGRNMQIYDTGEFGTDGIAVDVSESSQVNMQSARVLRSRVRAISAYDNSRVNARVCTIDGVTNSHGVVAGHNSHISVVNSIVVNSNGNDLRIVDGGFITARNTTTSSTPTGEGRPNIDDVNISNFNELNRLGYILT